MKSLTQALVRVVDDDPTVLESLRFMLEIAGFSVRLYPGADEFLKLDDMTRLGCLILDVRMPKMSGLELQHVLCDQGTPLPIIFLTGHGDIEMAVEALHDGAVDFLVKPPEPGKLVATVEKAIARHAELLRTEADRESIRQLVEQLTPAELEVAQMMSNGLANKLIAQTLGVSEQTIKMHRTNIYHKFDAVNPVEVAQIMIEYNRGRAA